MKIRQDRCETAQTNPLLKTKKTTSSRHGRINELAHENDHKIHLQQSRKHRNRKPNVKFWLMHSIQNASQRQGGIR